MPARFSSIPRQMPEWPAPMIATRVEAVMRASFPVQALHVAGATE